MVARAGDKMPQAESTIFDVTGMSQIDCFVKCYEVDLCERTFPTKIFLDPLLPSGGVREGDPPLRTRRAFDGHWPGDVD